MKLQIFLPHYEVAMRHEIFVSTSPERAYEALKRTNFSNSSLIRLLFWMRGIKIGRLFAPFNQIFTTLSDERPREIVLGMIGRPWSLRGEILSVDPWEYKYFDQKGYAKIAWNFAFNPQDGGTLISTETRVHCTDTSSRKKFNVYWFFIGPFSMLVRMEMLRLIRKETLRQKPIF